MEDPASSPNRQRAIAQALEAVASRLHGTGAPNSEWSRQVGEALCELGHGEGFMVCAHPSFASSADQCEWLFDLAWVRMSGPFYESVAMACECEWDTEPSEIERDLMKLVVSRAHLRVFIYQQPNEASAAEILNRMRAIVRNFAAASDKDEYLVCAFDMSRGVFTFSRL